jgi:flagellar biosynthesis protein FliQ
MNEGTVTQLAVQAMTVALMVSAPFLLAGLAVGLIVSIIQAATSIQEQTLSFIPKVVVTGVVIAIGGPWMMDQLVGYTQQLFQSIPSLVGP